LRSAQCRRAQTLAADTKAAHAAAATAGSHSDPKALAKLAATAEKTAVSANAAAAAAEDATSANASTTSSEFAARFAGKTGQGFWAQARRIVASTFSRLGEDRRHFFTTPNSFEIFGLDFLVDAFGAVELLEANPEPR